MQISERELRAMTADMVEMHNETFPTLRTSLADLGSTMRSRASSRRVFLRGSGVAVFGVVALAACGSDDDSGTPAAGGASPERSEDDKMSADLSGLATNASLENLAVFAYTQALAAAPKGKFGPTVPPAIAEFAMHARSQHSDHAQAFNAALKNAGGQAFTKPDPALAGPVTEMFTALKDLPGLAKLALTLENTAAATYTRQMGEFTSVEALTAVATIAPVERQHAAILSFVLGEYPVPDTFVQFGETPTSLGARPNKEAGV